MVDSDIWSQILETQKRATTTALHSAVCAEGPKHRISEKRMVAARNVSKSVVEQWSFRWRFRVSCGRSLQKYIMKTIQVPFLHNKCLYF